ncbi:MAG: glycosyltransferase family 4 protein, partial [Planctomycetota bacterium]|nr:glycosyltransferase family 4 protein [Planctomycetota bacterium]
SYRFFVHVLAAVLAVFLVGGLPPLPIGAMAVDLSWAGDVLAVVFLVWLTNLYNFMDGIDGIAAVETIFVAGAAAAIAYTGDTHFILVLEIGIAAACIGFLIWNWPPAKIFMGDVGSGFVGFALGALAIVSAQQGLLPIWTWLILAGVFVADATVTVIRRMARGERWYEAHRSHAYQRLARRHGNHRSVTLLVCAVNVAWLLPIAAASASWPDLGWMLTIVAWLPLLVAAAFLGAGLPDEERVTATDSQRQNTL